MDIFDPFHKLRITAITLGVVAVLTTWNGVFNRISNGIVFSINAVVPSNAVKYVWPIEPGLIFTLSGFSATIDAVERNYFAKIIEVEFKHKPSHLGIFGVVSEHVAKIRLPFLFLSTWMFGHHFRLEAAAALCSTLRQMAVSNRSLFSAGTFTRPHGIPSGFSFNGVTVSYYRKLSKQFSSHVNSLHVLTTGSCRKQSGL